MKKLFLAALLLTGCSKDRYVKNVQESLPKTVVIYVTAIAQVPELSVDDGALTVTIATKEVTYAGSGVFVTPNGHVLSVAHLVNESIIKAIDVVDYWGTHQRAELLYKDPRFDLSLLKINSRSPEYAKIADPRKLEVGQETIAIGNPLGFPFTVTHGIISRLYTDDVGYNLTQSDTFINPGNSGGPLFNMQGELVGINNIMVCNTEEPTFTGLGFSVQAGQIIEFLTKFKGLDKAVM